MLFCSGIAEPLAVRGELAAVPVWKPVLAAM